jgi:hypothetical protein
MSINPFRFIRLCPVFLERTKLLDTSLGSEYTIFDRNVATPRNLLDNTPDTITQLCVIPHREVFAHCLLVGMPKKSHSFRKDNTHIAGSFLIKSSNLLRSSMNLNLAGEQYLTSYISG